MHVMCARVSACVCPSSSGPLTDCDCISIGFSAGANGEQGPDEEMGSDGKTHLLFPDTFPPRVCGHHTHTHTRTEWCPQLLGVLPVLMRCESGTEMKQVERRWIRETDRERERGKKGNHQSHGWKINKNSRVGKEDSG